MLRMMSARLLYRALFFRSMEYENPSGDPQLVREHEIKQRTVNLGPETRQLVG